MKIAQMLALAMLLGSIPFGHIAVYIRSRGSSKTSDGESSAGTSPADRTGLVVVAILNVAKGFVPVYLTMAAFVHTRQMSISMGLLAGAIAVLSHNFPYWFMFRRSGKGGSVAIGVVLAFVVACIFKYI
ncbi:MAG: glycerol-3-phosphate acyltransferase [Armatimonadota bacterium]|jgi:glycerol-3-phosphate acyltransferase PlsY